MAESLRIQLCRVLRDAIEALPEFDSCQFLRQQGNDFSGASADRAVAIIHPTLDTVDDPTTGTRVDSGPGVGGTTNRTLSVQVDVYVADPRRNGVDVEQPQPQEDVSTVELLDRFLVLVENAIEGEEINDSLEAVAPGCIAAVQRTSYLSTDDGPIVGGSVVAQISYRHAQRDSRVSP